MSVDDVVKIKSAYEKMLEDGSAFKEVDMSMMVEPDLAMAEGGLGDKINEQPQPSQPQENSDSFIDEHTDFSQHDSEIERRMQSLRNKMNGGGQRGQRGQPQNKIALLEKRVERLEKALMLVMETHEKILS